MLCRGASATQLPIKLSALIFAIVGLVQVLRLFGQWTVMINTFQVPLWVSAIAAVVAWTMCGWLLYTAKHSGQPL
jgi:hypothetical protein